MQYREIQSTHREIYRKTRIANILFLLKFFFQI
jgi:hypothetical protein